MLQSGCGLERFTVLGEGAPVVAGALSVSVMLAAPLTSYFEGGF